MVSIYENPSSWRQRTEKQFVPYRLIELTGTADSETRTVTAVYLVPTDSLTTFINEMVPTPEFINGIPSYKNAYLPNNTEMRARSLSWKAHIESKPIDPLGTDTGAPAQPAAAGTYGQVCEVTVQYDNQLPEPVMNDPWTYLDVSASVAGEYMSVDLRDANWDSPTGDQIQDQTLPLTLIVPEVEWTVVSRMVSKRYFEDTLKVKLDTALGRVNSSAFVALLESPAGCSLFVGFETEETGVLTYPDGTVDLSLTITLKFLEKRIYGDAGLFTHQHVYDPGEGRWRLVYVKEQPLYKTYDMNSLFSG